MSGRSRTGPVRARRAVTSPYRSSDEALVQQIEATDLRISELESAFTRDFWEELAPELGLEPRKRSVKLPLHRRPDELATEFTRREARLDALERLVSRFEDIEAMWRTPPGELPTAEAVATDHLLEDGFTPHDGVGKEFVALIERLFPGSSTERLDQHMVAASVRYRDELFRLTCQSVLAGTTRAWLPVVIASATIPRGAFTLRIEPKTFTRELLERIGLARKVDLGDSALDAMFTLIGDEAATKASLGPELRRVLAQLVHDDIPYVEIRPGLARVSWRSVLSDTSIRAAIEALLVLRRSRAVRPLRKVR